MPKFTLWHKNQTAFEAMAAYDEAGPGFTLTGSGAPERIKAMHASQEYFRVFGVSPILGRTFRPEEDVPNGPRVAVVSNGLWKTRFGSDATVIGRALLLNGAPYTVIGVLPAEFLSDPAADIWIPLQPDPNSANQGNYLAVAARLKPGVTLSTANAQLKIIGEQFRRQSPKWMDKNETVSARPMQQEKVGDVRPALLVLFGAVGFVLLIACANVANLLLARAASRQKEIAVRTALGASRWRVIRMLLSESVLLGGVAGLLGLFLGLAGVRALLAVSPGDLPRINEISKASTTAMIDWRVLAFTVSAAVATGILFGLFPALQLSKPDLNSTLKESSGRGATGYGHNRARALLVVTEIALAVVLVVGAALLVQTFLSLRAVRPGFDPHNVLTLQIPMGNVQLQTTAAVERFNSVAVQRVEAIPGVIAAAPALVLPISGISIDLPFNVEGQPPRAGLYSGDEFWNAVGPHFFRALKIPLVRGREFTEGDGPNSARVLIVDETFVKRYLAKADPIGQQVTIARGLGPEFSEPTRTIVGVVGDVRQENLGSPIEAHMYIPMSQITDRLTAWGFQLVPSVWVVRTQSEPMALARSVQREIMSVNGEVAVAEIRTMEQIVSKSLARSNFTMLLLTTFAAIALALAAVGIYGVMSYAVSQRRHEIGIRMALGANRHKVLRMVVWNGLRLAGTGVAIGIAGALSLTRLITSMLFGVRPTDPATFAGVAGALVAVALLATWAPAWRATQVDPVIALRYE
jgi:predicted permease